MEILNKRAMSNFDERFNPQNSSFWRAGTEFKDAEVAFEDEGKKLFAKVGWCSLEPDEISACVTDESIFDLYEKVYTDESLGDRLIEKEDKIMQRNSAGALGYSLCEKYQDQIVEACELLAEAGMPESEDMMVLFDN